LGKMATDLDRLLSVSITSSDAPDVPLNLVLCPDAEPIKIGRNPKNEVVVNRGGVSWTHLELLVSTDAHDNAILEVKDLSSNGAVLQLPYQHGRRLEKGVATAVPHCAVLLLPYRVKEEAEASGNARTQLLVRIEGEEDPVPPPPDGEAAPMPLHPDQAPPPPPEDEQPAVHSGASMEVQAPPPPPEPNLAARSRSRSRSRRSPGRRALRDSYDPEATHDAGTTMVDAADAAVESVLASRSEVATAVESNGSRRGRRGEKENAPTANARPANNGAALTPGCKVRVVGFQAKGEWNGKCGTLLQLDAVAGIWKVRMEDGSGKAFRPRNLELVEEAPKPAGAPGPNADAASAPTAGNWQGADLVAGLPVLSKASAPKLPPLLTGPLPGPLPTGPPPRGPPPSGPPPLGPPPLGPPPQGPPPLGPPPNRPGLPAPVGFMSGPPPSGPPPSGPPPSGPPPSGPPPSGLPPSGPPPNGPPSTAVMPTGAAVPVGMPLPLTMQMPLPMAMPLGVPPLGFPMPASQGIPQVPR